MAPSPEDGDAGANGNGHDHGPGHLHKATKRSRWATRKLTVKSSSIKRLSLMGRKHNRTMSTEKKRQSGGSGGSESLRQPNGTTQQAENADANSVTVSEDATNSRTLYFNIPLPEALTDENGRPMQTYTRNKIRTAKYTPLSFFPKNLWFQFHNIANIFFLFLVILDVRFPLSSVPSSSIPPLPLPRRGGGIRTLALSPVC